MKRDDVQPFLKDGNLKFSGGVDMGQPPSDIDRNQLAFAVNCTMRNGPAKPRPGWKQRKLTFPENLQEPFEAGRFQTGFFYNGDEFDALLCSHGGRQFKIEIDKPSGVLTTCTASFTIPLQGGTVAVPIADTSLLNSQSNIIYIGVYRFQLVSIDSSTQITVLNPDAAYAGFAVPDDSDVQFRDTWYVTEITPNTSTTTITTADFVIPAVGASVVVSVQDATKMVPGLAVITIGGYNFDLTTVNSPTSIVVTNQTSANVGLTVTQPATVTFAFRDVNDPTAPLNWSEQAENYWVLQNNGALPVIFDGSTSFRSDPAKDQVPVGNVMCYAMGRLSVAMPDRRSYMVGDLVFDASSGTAGKGFRDSVLYFKSNKYDAGGGVLVAKIFGAPSNSGDILAMKAAAMTDSQLGQGPMQVGTPNVVFSVYLPFDRTIWQNLQNALQTANPIKGPVSQDSTVLHNTDLWYKAIDGIRSYLTAQRQFNGSWGNTPQSNEVDPILKYDTQEWSEYASGVIFDNRLLMTISPQMTGNGCYHRGLAVLDFDLTTSIKEKRPPAWEGIWTGLRILKIVCRVSNRVERCFMWVLNDESKIELWELSKSDKLDNETIPISWQIAMPSYNCRDSDAFKKLMAARMIVKNISGTFSGTLEYRSDSTSCWASWDTFSRCAQDRDCGPFDCDVPNSYQPQPRYPIRFTEPPDEFDDVSNRKKSTGYEFQPRLALSGYAEIHQFRIYCLPEPENLGVENLEET